MGYSALIPAAGRGERLGQGPKAWLELAGRPLFAWLVLKLMASADEVVAAVAEQDMAHAARVVAQHGLRVRLLEGGPTRQETVWRLVEAARCDQVLLQDVARPFATRALCAQVTDAARAHGAAAALLSLDVPVARIERGQVTGYLPASETAVFQAPQGFARAPLLEVLRQARHSGTQRQSTLQLWLDAGHRIVPVPGESTNIKLTRPEDLVLAQSLKEYLFR